MSFSFKAVTSVEITRITQFKYILQRLRGLHSILAVLGPGIFHTEISDVVPGFIHRSGLQTWTPQGRVTSLHPASFPRSAWNFSMFLHPDDELRLCPPPQCPVCLVCPLWKSYSISAASFSTSLGGVAHFDQSTVSQHYVSVWGAHIYTHTHMHSTLLKRCQHRP